MIELFQRLSAAAAPVLAFALVAGCAASSVQLERGHLSGEVQRRTGSSLRDAASMSNQLPPKVELADGISEDEAVAIALWNNAAFQENLSRLGIARGDLAQAGLLANPSFSVLFPLGPKQLEFAATLPVEALWLRERRVAVAKLDAGRIAEGLVQNGLDLVRDVRAGFSDLALARDHVRLAREAVALRGRIVKITEAPAARGRGQRAGRAGRAGRGRTRRR